MKKYFLLLAAAAMAIAAPARASIAYGSIDNFDCVNDCGQECHGFEIEVDDCHSKDITYTYDWNHYGAPRITEDNTDPAHPKCFIRWESGKNPDGSWAAYTAIPSGPITPTDGHQFTDPSVNFGGEHYGVGFYTVPSGTKYAWLVDDGTGHLTHGCPVNISTPVFTYQPPAAGQPAQVQVKIAPPAPPEAPVKEFGDAMWVKETRTQTHNNNKVELKDLVSDDPNDPNDKNWKNGEPDEVEVEWQLLQTEFSQDNGGLNGELAGAAEPLENGDEVITRRWDFYKYTGPIDPETGEARCDNVGPDGVHGVGTRVEDGVAVDYSNYVVVGDYIGAQMAGFDAAGQLGLIDHLQDAEVNSAYPERRVVINGKSPIQTTITGTLPLGMTFNTASGILSGTPTETGGFTITIHSHDAAGADLTKTYDLTVRVAGALDGTYDFATPYALIASAFGVTNNDFNNDGICDPNQLDCLAHALTSGLYPDLNAVFLANRATAANDVGPYILPYYPGLDSLFAAWEMLGMDDVVASVFASCPECAGSYSSANYDHAQDGVVAGLETACNVGPCGGGEGEGEGEGQVVVDPLDLLTPYVTVASLLGSTNNDVNADQVCDQEQLSCLQTALQEGSNVALNTAYLANKAQAAAVLGDYFLQFIPGFDNLIAAWTMLGLDGWVTTLLTDCSICPSPYDVNQFDRTQNAAVAAIEAGCGVANCVVAGEGEGEGAAEGEGEGEGEGSAEGEGEGEGQVLYNISTIAEPAAGGSTTGDGLYTTGSTVTIGATPNTGYSFLSWTEGSSLLSANAMYTLTADANHAFVANFVRNSYNIGVQASEGGTATGGGSVLYGDNTTVTAAPSTGYLFANWTENGEIVSGSAAYTFAVTGNHDLLANFEREQYTVSTAAGTGGTTSGGGTFYYGDNVTVSAVPDAGYAFTNWTEGGEAVSGNASYTFAAGANRALVANFTRISYTITVSAGTGGTVSGGGTAYYGDSITVTAQPNTGYVFTKWTENGALASRNAAYTFTVKGDRTLAAVFTATKVTITTAASPVEGGTVTASRTVNYGTNVTFRATANTGYGFASWTEGGTVVSMTAAYTFSAVATRNLVANFVPLPVVTGVSVPSPISGGQTTTGTVSLSSVAPAAGTSVALRSSKTAVLTVPASVVVPAGQSTVEFPVTTTAVTKTTSVTVRATRQGISATTTVSVTK